MCKQIMVLVVWLGLSLVPAIVAQDEQIGQAEGSVTQEATVPATSNAPAVNGEKAPEAQSTKTEEVAQAPSEKTSAPEVKTEASVKVEPVESEVVSSEKTNAAPINGAAAPVAVESKPIVTESLAPTSTEGAAPKSSEPVIESKELEKESSSSESQKQSEVPAPTVSASSSAPAQSALSVESTSKAAEVAKESSPASSTSEKPAAKASGDEGKGEELVGIDTVNVDEPAGNWLYKRLYWERAEDKYQKIKELMAAIFDARTKFFDQRIKLDKEIFDPLYTLASFRRGELSGVLKDLLEDIEKRRAKKNELDDNASVLFAKVEANKERLEEVQKEIEFVGKIDAAVDEAINTLIGLLNQGRNFEMQAWGDFKAISRELSDKKARDLFYRIDTYWRNVKDIQVYITTKLAEHMNYLASNAQQHADTVKGLLKELEDQGFVLKEQVDALEKAKTGAVSVDQEDEMALKVKAKKGGFLASVGNFFSMIVKPFVAIAKALWHTIVIPFNYFFGDKKPAQPEPVPAAPEVVLEGASAQKQALPEAP